MNSAALKEHPLLTSLRMIWGASKDLNDWVNEHIDDLKKSANETVAATGRVLEGAKFGFGLGYLAPTALTMAGQLLLGGLQGNSISAVFAASQTAAHTVTFTNPIAVTCGAIGAIYFGWRALSEQERNAIVDRVAQVFNIGVELVRSFIDFLFKTMATVFTEENIAGLKNALKEAAEAIGRTLSSITKALKDRFTDAADAVGEGVDKATENVRGAANSVSETAEAAFRSASDAISKAYDDLRDALGKEASKTNKESLSDSDKKDKGPESN